MARRCARQPESGAVDMALIDQAVGRVLAMKFRMGLFERPYVAAEPAPAVFDTPEQRDLARQIARQSIVLLKNQAGLLPLRNNDMGTIAVIGPGMTMCATRWATTRTRRISRR